MTSGKSLSALPTTLTRVRARRSCDASHGRCSSRTESTPGFARPMALIIPPSNSATRGAGAPVRGARLTAFVTMPPSASSSRTSDNSRPYAAVPAARTMGFWKEIPATETVSRDDATLRLSAPNPDTPVVVLEVVHRRGGDALGELPLVRSVEEQRRIVDVRRVADLDEHRRHVGRDENAERPLLHPAIEHGLVRCQPLLDDRGELARFAKVLVLRHVVDDEREGIFLGDV